MALTTKAGVKVDPLGWDFASASLAGRDALNYYHERLDENRNIGLGPEHDWSIHCADCFGHMSPRRQSKNPGNGETGAELYLLTGEE